MEVGEYRKWVSLVNGAQYYIVITEVIIDKTYATYKITQGELGTKYHTSHSCEIFWIQKYSDKITKEEHDSEVFRLRLEE